MDSTILVVIAAVIALVVGIVAGKFLFKANTEQKLQEAENQAKKIISDAQLQAETLKKEKMLEAKEKFVQLKAEHDKEVLDRNRKLGDAENRIKQKEVAINQKDSALEKQMKENEAIKENLNRQIELVNIKRTELE
jgi:ribonuclease Y